MNQKTKEKFLEEARRRHKHATESDTSQRNQEFEDLAFQIPDNQWTEQAKKEREGRPRLSISKIDQPIQRVLNQERAAHLGVNIHALSEDASDDTAEIIQGLYRHIERDSHASQAREWAYQRSVISGRGFWRVNCEYDDESGNPFDQKIMIEPIYYQHSVLFDPAATRFDKDDASYCFVESWVDEDTYRRLWPDADLPTTEYDFEAAAQYAPDWTESKDGVRSFRVVEYWYKEWKSETIVMLEDGTVVTEDELPKRAKIMKGANGQPLKRKRDKVMVKFSKISGFDVLETVDWDGKHIPIIPLIGRELQPYDGKRRYVGLVNHARGAQMFFNYSVSTYLERMSMEPKAPIVGYVGQFEGVEEQWDELNRRPVARLEVNPVVDKVSGQVLPLPQRMQIDLSGMSLAGQAMNIADGLVQSTTTVYDASLGRLTEDNRKSSGRALLALQQESDVSTSDFMERLSAAMQYEARVILDLMPAKYDRPGRVTRILRGDDDKAETIMINMPYVMGKNGRPSPMLGGMPLPQRPPMPQQPMPTAAGIPSGMQPQVPGMPPMAPPAQPQQPPVHNYDLRKGTYGVSVTIGRSLQTRLQHGAEFMSEILEKMPQFLPLLGDLLFRYRDDPGAKEIADRLAKVRERQFPGLGEGEDGQVPPEQLQAQLEAQKQQIEQMQMQMQAAMKALETEQAKQQATIMKTQMETASKERISTETNQTKILIEQISAQLQAQASRIEMALGHAQDTKARQEQMGHEAALTAMKLSGDREARREEAMEQDRIDRRAAMREDGQEARQAMREDAMEARSAQRDDIRGERQAARDDARYVHESARADRSEEEAGRREMHQAMMGEEPQQPIFPNPAPPLKLPNPPAPKKAEKKDDEGGGGSGAR